MLKNMWFQTISRLCGWAPGAINWYLRDLRDLVTVPLIRCLSSAVMCLQEKQISHLQSRNLLEITATKNVTRSAYQD